MIFIDQTGNEVYLENFPKRIISLVPSQTELLYHLDLDTEIVGITKFCISPEHWYKNKNRVGGPKQLDIQKIKDLQPDLIIGNKEENVKEQIEELYSITPVWLSDIYNLEDSYEMISQIGELCNKTQNAERINSQIKENFSTLQPLNNNQSVLYLIWKKPFMAVASQTFIHTILSRHLGLKNIMENNSRYPVLDDSNLPQPDFVFLSTEPYPFKEKHINEIQPYFPNSKLMIVDGEAFTWYGSRLIDTPRYLKEIQELIIHKGE